MKNLALPISLNKSELKLVENRIAEFKKLYHANNEAWFSELCFCLLTANAQAKRAMTIQDFLGAQGFMQKSEEELAQTIKSFGHRFHNNKAKYIVVARKHAKIKDELIGFTGSEAREYLAKNIKGLGYKEASHFLRNVGYSDVSIIDRHILRFLEKYGFIKEIPKVVTPKKYLEIEAILKKFDMDLDKLDLMLWYHMTGTVLK